MDISELDDIVTRHGANMVARTIQRKASLLQKGKFPRRNIKDGVAQVNPTTGVVRAGPGADGATYTKRAPSDIDTLIVHRKLFYDMIEIPRGAADSAKGAAGVHLVNTRIDDQFGTLVMTLEQAILDPQIGVCATTSSAIASSAVDVIMVDATRFREGQHYYWDDNGTVETTNPFLCTNVVMDDSGIGGTVSFSTSATGTITADEDKFILVDSTNSRSVVSLRDLAGSGNVYTQTGAIAGWKGVTLAHDNQYSAEAILRLAVRMRNRGADPKLGICSPFIEAEHRALYGSSTYRKFEGDSDEKLDPFGNGEITINGIRFLVTPNCPADKVFLIDPEDVKLGVFKDWTSLLGEKVVPSQVGHNYLIGQEGQFNVVAENRRGVGMITGFTFA